MVFVTVVALIASDTFADVAKCDVLVIRIHAQLVNNMTNTKNNSNDMKQNKQNEQILKMKWIENIADRLKSSPRSFDIQV